MSKDDLKRAIGRVSWKSHQNGAKNPKAHLQKAVEMETILKAKPSAAKGRYVRSVTLSSTMGPGVAIDTAHVDALGRH